MCGVVGFIGPPHDEGLAGMTTALARRGPDDEGRLSWEHVHLGFRRLSVIDLATGSQPLTTASGRCTVVFNGEVYNHRALRQELTSAGHRFQTDHADTEVIAVGYEAWGPAVVEKLEGMFAFVLLDRERRSLFGARDRMGQKPLYLLVEPRPGVRFAFSSSLPSLAAHPGVRAGLEVSPGGLLSYLTHDYVAGRPSVYRGVDRLGPGEAFERGLEGDDELRRWRWYRPQRPARVPSRFEDAARVVRQAVDRAVRSRLEADVPLGVLLSGGLDSSLIAALAARARPGQPIDTFSIGFTDPRYDESDRAEEVARWVGSRHHRQVFGIGELIDRAAAVLGDLDEPFADPSVLPTDLLAEVARREVTVALGGDGGDELFFGYELFPASRVADAYQLGPLGLRRAAERFVDGRAPAAAGPRRLKHAAQRFARGGSSTGPARVARWLAPFTPHTLRRVAPELCPAAASLDALYLGPVLAEESGDALVDTARFYQQVYLPDDILVKADRASMRHGLELRAPLLATEVVELANALPTRFKLRGGRGKRVLKQAALSAAGGDPLLPASIVHRSKQGFGVPVAEWIRGPLRDRFYDELLAPWPAELAAFDRGEIRSLLDRHVTGHENRYKELWALFALRRWAERAPHRRR